MHNYVSIPKRSLTMRKLYYSTLDLPKRRFKTSVDRTLTGMFEDTFEC